MGFMDKAKKLAEQAQTKLDEVQKDLNAKQGTGGGQQTAGSVVEYDEHGRPKGQAQPAAPTAATPQQGDPVADSATAPAPSASAEPAAEVRATPTQGDPLLEETEKKPTPPPGGGMTSGDPLG